MPIATRRNLTNRWVIPGIDIYDPSLVLYAPLWRPDMVARGGSIVNGTGTMDVSPQNLAVGANTITVTAAGTLIVRLPEGGTVASGTMTVTGSPVTVSAGIATTITTTGAIGNITVTPSNIIRSKDRNNHALTVTGATWGTQGRTFDNIDDFINCGASTAFDLTTQLTIIVACKTTGAGVLVSKWAVATPQRSWGFTASGAIPQLYLSDDGTGNESQSANTVLSGTGSQIIGVSYSTSDNIAHFYRNGITDGNKTFIAETGSIFVGTANVYVGDEQGGAIGGFFGGDMGDVKVFNRSLSALEHQNNYLATKGRYQ